MSRRSPNGRPLTGRRLCDTTALVNASIPKPQGCYELHWPPSAECMVTPIDQGGCKPPSSGDLGASPDRGNTARRAVDYLRSWK